MTVSTLETVYLEHCPSTADAIRLLAAAIESAVPLSEKGCDVKRALLRCLLDFGLAQLGEAGWFSQSLVSLTQVGALMAKARIASPPVASSFAAYGKISRVIKDVDAALISVVNVGKDTYVLLHVQWLRDFIPTSLSAATAEDVPQPTPLPSTNAPGSHVQTAGAAPTKVLIVTTAADAETIVDCLLQHQVVGVDTEGDLERNGSVCLVQLYAGGGAFIFDLHAALPSAKPSMVRQLDRLLGDPNVVKVMHDCRKDCEALYYMHGIRAEAIWDAQVAYGWVQMTKGVAQGSSSDDDGSLLVGMNSLLEKYRLPPNPHKSAMHKRMDREPDLWTKRPLEQAVIDYAVADVDRLPALRAVLVEQLGKGGDAVVLRLSKAYSEWYFDEADRSCHAQPGSYAAAARIPAGCDLQMKLDPLNGYRPRFSAFLEPVSASEAGSASSESEKEDLGVTAVLSLFPDRIRAGIERLCGRGRSQQASAAGLSTAVEQMLLDDPFFSSSSASASSTSDAVEEPPVQRRPIEVVVDAGRPVTVRFSDGREEDLEEPLDVKEALERLAQAKNRLQLGGRGSLFFEDNRTGIPGTLHRISAMKGREDKVLGLTYRIGRHVPGVGRLIMDILAQLSAGHPCSGAADSEGDLISASLLLLGPGVGKTTLLRDVSSLLADTFRKRVIVVDTSNEIAGDGEVPHACIGRARRMMVNSRDSQHSVMIEGVQNHNPEVMVVDEIGTSKEVTAAKSIAQRGVVIVGTAHGTSLEGLLKNPELNPLVGGVHQVLLGDMEAKQTNAGSKTRTERKGAPTFSTLVEVLSYDRWRIHLNVARSVDAILAGRQPHTQLRWYDSEGRMMVKVEGAAGGANSTRGALRQVLKTGQQQSLGESKSASLAQLVNLAALY